MDAASLLKQKATEGIASYIGRCSKVFKGCQEDIPDKIQVMYAQRGLLPLNKIVSKIQAPNNLLELKNICESHESCEVGPLPIHTIEQLDDNQNPLIAVVDTILKSKEEADKRLLESNQANNKMIASLNQLKQDVSMKKQQEGIERQFQVIHNLIEQMASEKNTVRINDSEVYNNRPLNGSSGNRGDFNRTANYQNGNRNYQRGYRNYQSNNQNYQGNNRNYQGNRGYQGNNQNGYQNYQGNN
jgi:hypothetical protein